MFIYCSVFVWLLTCCVYDLHISAHILSRSRLINLLTYKFTHIYLLTNLDDCLKDQCLQVPISVMWSVKQLNSVALTGFYFDKKSLVICW